MQTDAIIGAQLLNLLAGVYAQVGETDRAFELLEKLSHLRAGITYGSLKLDPTWDTLRNHARFEKLIASLAPAGT